MDIGIKIRLGLDLQLRINISICERAYQFLQGLAPAYSSCVFLCYTSACSLTSSYGGLL